MSLHNLGYSCQKSCHDDQWRLNASRAPISLEAVIYDVAISIRLAQTFPTWLPRPCQRLARKLIISLQRPSSPCGSVSMSQLVIPRASTRLLGSSTRAIIRTRADHLFLSQRELKDGVPVAILSTGTESFPALAFVPQLRGFACCVVGYIGPCCSWIQLGTTTSLLPAMT